MPTIFGTNLGDVLFGSAGADTIVGQGGDDTISPLGGADVIDGGLGVDELDYSGSSSGITMGLDGFAGRGGDAQGDVAFNVENLTGSLHDDTLYGNAQDNLLWGLDGNDNLWGNEGDDTLWGGNGDDTLRGGEGADVLDGGSGTDMARYVDSATGIVVSLADNFGLFGSAAGDTFFSVENLAGSAFDDILIGDGNANVLDGIGGSNLLSGRDGDDTLLGADDLDFMDTLNGGSGADLLDGGAGTDQATYWDSAGAVTIDLAAGTGSGGDAEGDILISIETVVGSSHDDMLRGDAGANILSGINGDDRLLGEGGADELYGGDGNDTLRGGEGADTLDGGDGTNTASYIGSALAVTINLGDGTASGGDATGDTLIDIQNVTGSGFADLLIGDDGGNLIAGAGGDDQIFGEDGNDTLRGGAGADTLDGGAGSADVANYFYSDAGVNVNLLTGVGTGGHATGDALINIEDLIGSFGADTLTGGTGDNSLNGLMGADDIDGGHGSDSLFGGQGNDTLNGGAGDGYGLVGPGQDGQDQLTGGGGADTFVFTVDIAANSGFGDDRVVDFESGVDTLVVEGAVLDSQVSMFGDEVLHFVDAAIGNYIGTIILQGLAGLFDPADLVIL